MVRARVPSVSFVIPRVHLDTVALHLDLLVKVRDSDEELLAPNERRPIDTIPNEPNAIPARVLGDYHELLPLDREIVVSFGESRSGRYVAPRSLQYCNASG